MARRSPLALMILSAALVAGCSGGDADAVQDTQSVEPADTEAEEVDVEEQQPPPEDTAPGQGPGEPSGRGFEGVQLDLAAAAEQLDVTEEELTTALGDIEQGPLDFEAAAEALGVTVDELIATLSFPDGDEPRGPGADIVQLDVAAAAGQLGVTKEELTAALGDLEQGMPDFEAAATQLGVTVEELYTALGLPEGFAPGSRPSGEPPANE